MGTLQINDTITSFINSIYFSSTREAGSWGRVCQRKDTVVLLLYRYWGNWHMRHLYMCTMFLFHCVLYLETFYFQTVVTFSLLYYIKFRYGLFNNTEQKFPTLLLNFIPVRSTVKPINCFLIFVLVFCYTGFCFKFWLAFFLHSMFLFATIVIQV